MILTDEDDLICDLAETYQIVDYRSYSLSFIATLARGLRETSRIKLKLSKIPIDVTTLLIASIADSCNFIAWSKTEDAHNGNNRPESIVARLTGKEQKKESDIMAFASPEEFEKARAKLIGGDNGN